MAAKLNHGREHNAPDPRPDSGRKPALPFWGNQSSGQSGEVIPQVRLAVEIQIHCEAGRFEQHVPEAEILLALEGP